MSPLKSFLTAFWLLALLSCSNQISIAQLNINVPTIEQEATSIWRTINDIVFLEQQGYKINLPTHPTIDSLLQKSKAKNFGNTDYEKIYRVLDSSIYDKSKYDLALEKVKAQEDLINTLITQLKKEKDSWDWAFQTFDQYDVVFTHYGTGGSYDPDLGLVTLFTDEEGKFMRYENPANTIMHEIVHMGIEKSIVQKYNISHGLKERIVDRITYLLFHDKLSDYKIQNMGDPRIDDFLNDEMDLKKIGCSVRKISKGKIVFA